MSVEAMSWVFKRSPYRAEARCVHLAMADIANDEHGQLLYVNDAALANKAQVSRGGLNRIKARMIEDGYLEDTGDRTGKTGSIKVYRMLFPEAVTQGDTLDSSEAVTPSVEGVTQGAEAVTLTTIEPLYRTQVTQGNASVASPKIERLCEVLAHCIEANGSKRPTVTKAWLSDMDKLVRIDGRTPQDVEAAILWCQQDEFWHRNILSPSKLRKHFDRLRLDARAKDRPKRSVMEETAQQIEALRGVNWQDEILGGEPE